VSRIARRRATGCTLHAVAIEAGTPGRDNCPATFHEPIDDPYRPIIQRAQIGQHQYLVLIEAVFPRRSIDQPTFRQHVERDVPLLQRQVQPLEFFGYVPQPIRLVTQRVRTQQQHPGIRHQPTIDLGMIPVVLDDHGSHLQALVVDHVGRAHDVGGRVRPSRDRLHEELGKVMRLLARQSVGHVDEPHRVNQHRLVWLEGLGGAHLLAGPVVPEWPTDRIVRLVEDHVRAVAQDQRGLRTARRDQPLDAGGQVVQHPGGEPAPRLVGVRPRPGRQFDARRVFAEQPLAGEALAHTSVLLGVVDLVVRHPVQEEAFHRIPIEHLVQHIEQPLLVILRAGADAGQPVVNLRLTVRTQEAPFRILLRAAVIDLGEVHPRQQVNATLGRCLRGIADQVTGCPLRQRGIRCLEPQVRGVIRQDAAHADQPRIRAVALDEVQRRLDIETGVDLA
jgi:hypothetical protein